MRGVHPPIVSQELFDAVHVLTGRSETAQSRQVLNADFPPRQFIRCAKCASVGDATKEVGGHWNFNVQLQFPSDGARTHFIPRAPLALRMISNHRHGLALARLCTWKISTGTRLGMMVQTLPTRRPTSISTIQTARQKGGGYPWVWEGVSAGGNPGGHWETRDALSSTQLSFMAGRARNCDCGPAEVDAALVCDTSGSPSTRIVLFFMAQSTGDDVASRLRLVKREILCYARLPSH